MTVHITGGTHQVAMAGEHLSPTQEIPLSLRFVLKRPRNLQPKEAGGETHRLEITRPRNGDTSLLRENELCKPCAGGRAIPARGVGSKGNWNLAGPVTALFSLIFFVARCAVPALLHCRTTGVDKV